MYMMCVCIPFKNVLHNHRWLMTYKWVSLNLLDNKIITIVKPIKASKCRNKMIYKYTCLACAKYTDYTLTDL